MSFLKVTTLKTTVQHSQRGLHNKSDEIEWMRRESMHFVLHVQKEEEAYFPVWPPLKSMSSADLLKHCRADSESFSSCIYRKMKVFS